MNLNQHTLIGFVGNDAETKLLPNGTPVTKFSIATKRSWKDKDDEWQEHAQWHQIVAFGEGLHALASRLKKGAHVFVQGELRTRKYAKNVGTAKNAKAIDQLVVETIADTIRPLDRSANGQRSNATDGPPDFEEVPN